MAVVDVEGCVLRTMDYREQDRILSILSGTHGRMDVIARGARKSFKRFGGHLQLFSRVLFSVDYRPSRSLHSLRGAMTREAWPALQEDLVRFAAASYLGEVALRTAVEGSADPGIYTALITLLGRLADSVPEEAEQTLRLGQAAFLERRGVLPDFERCVCGQPLSLSSRVLCERPDGVLFCERCARSGPRLERLEPEVVAALQHVGRLARGHEGGVSRDPAALRAAGGILGDAISALVGSELKSEAFLAQVLPPIVPSGPPPESGEV